MIAILAGHDPAVELRLIWQCTEEQVMRRWELFVMLDPIKRLFPGEDKGKRRADSTEVNAAWLEAALMRTLRDSEEVN